MIMNWTLSGLDLDNNYSAFIYGSFDFYQSEYTTGKHLSMDSELYDAHHTSQVRISLGRRALLSIFWQGSSDAI